jgi:autotransporter-associated beta strand protein
MKSACKSTRKLPCAFLVTAVILALPMSRAATKTWNSASGGDFNTPGNWTASGVPLAADTALFNIATGDVTLSSDATPGSLSFDTSAGTFSLGALAGNTITTVNNGSISVLSTLTGTGKTFTINAPLVLTPASASTAGAYTLQNNATDASNTLVVAGGITSGTTTNTTTLNLAGTNTGNNTVSGVIGNGSATTFAVTKSGAGTWKLSGANTYNGTTTISAGTLMAGVSTITGTSGALGTGNNGLTMSSTGFLDLNGFNVGVGALSSASNGNRILNNSGSGTATLTVGNNNTTGSYAGLIVDNTTGSGKVALFKEGTGTLTLSTANTFSGGVSINNGTVVYSGNNNGTFGTSAVTLGSGSNNVSLSFTGVPSLAAANTITVASGAGTRTITSSATGGGPTLNGAITLNKDLIVAATGGATGSLTLSGIISGSSGLVIDATSLGIINLRGASTFSGGIAINAGTLQGQNASSIVTSGNVTSGALGTGTVTLGATGSSASAGVDFPLAYAFANALTVTSGGTRTISMSGAGQTSAAAWNGSIALSNDLNLTAVSTTVTTGVNRLNIGNATGGITGSNNIIINNANTATGAVIGSGAINLGGGSVATLWTGNLIVQGGQGSISAVNAIGANNTVGVTSGATFNFSNTNAINPTIAGLSNATASALGGTTGGTVLHSQANNRVLTLGGSGNYSFAGTITNAVNGTNTTGLTVALTGSGSQTLSGTNLYTGATTVTSGKLLINGDNSAATGAVSVASAATLGGAGTVGGATTASSGSFLSAGATVGTVGTLTFASTLNISGLAGGTGGLLFDLDSTAASDKISLTSGALSIGTGVLDLNDFNFVALSGYGAGTYTLISTSTSITGTLGSALTGTFGGYDTALSISGNNIVLTVSAIPEPATYAALLGVLALGGTVWNRSRKSRK